MNVIICMTVPEARNFYKFRGGTYKGLRGWSDIRKAHTRFGRLYVGGDEALETAAARLNASIIEHCKTHAFIGFKVKAGDAKS